MNEIKRLILVAALAFSSTASGFVGFKLLTGEEVKFYMPFALSISSLASILVATVLTQEKTKQ